MDWIYLVYAYLNDFWKQLTIPGSQNLAIRWASDWTKSKQDLIAENALLRQQLIVLQRQVKSPKLTHHDRSIFVFLASLVSSWKDGLLIISPNTLLKWHRQGFRLWWRVKSKPKHAQTRISTEVIELIQQMSQDNRLWGAERIRGELLKLDIHVSKRTVQKYMQAREKDPQTLSTQTWKTFIANHAHETWACDFVQTYDLFFRTVFIFFIMEIGSRRVVHFNVTRHPTDRWVSQQLREATPYTTNPRFLIRDNDKKYGHLFSNVADGAQIEVLRTPIQSPKANAHCERFIGSVRHEFLDHVFVLSDKHLRRLTRDYVDYFNLARPHQGIDQSIPNAPDDTFDVVGEVKARPILNGLHHDYRRVA